MTDQQRLAEERQQLRERMKAFSWSIRTVLLCVIGLVLCLALMLPLGIVVLLARGLCWTGLPGLHWLGHAISRNLTTPVLDWIIGGAERARTWADKRAV